MPTAATPCKGTITTSLGWPRIAAGRWPALAGALAASLLAATTLAARADAGAIITNNSVMLGVQDLGQLNVDGGPPASDGFTTTVGVRDVATNHEALGRGPYEGWGLADAITGVTGYANGIHPSFTKGVQHVSFTSTGSTATSVVDVVGTGSTPVPTFRIKHEYYPSPSSSALFEGKVTIENISSSTVQPRYRRTMDWDVPPTPYAEYVTIDGSPFAALLYTSDAGYAISDPLSGPDDYGYTGFFTDGGPQDHGALFDFGFPALAPGATFTFFVYYGVAPTEAAANAAVQAVGAQTWSFGQSNPLTGTPDTFIFAYADGPAATPTCNGLPATKIGTSGPDTLVGTPGADVIVGLGGDDVLKGMNGNDTVCGGSGDDTLTDVAGNDKLFGGPGNDHLTGGANDDRLEGGNGNDTLAGNDGNDQLAGAAGVDLLTGGDGVDRLAGGLGDDNLAGNAGNDWLAGDGGNDTIAGGADNDWLIGAAGNDALTGDTGNDWLTGGADDDTLTGDAGNDWLIGDAGVDTINAVDSEIDQVDCGAGADPSYSVDPIDVVFASCP